MRNNRSKKKSTYILAKTWRARWLKNAQSNKKVFLEFYFTKELCLAVIMWWKFKIHYLKCHLITSLTFKAYFYLKFSFLISKHKFLSKVQFQFCVELLSKINYGNFLSLTVSDPQAIGFLWRKQTFAKKCAIAYSTHFCQHSKNFCAELLIFALT